MSELPRGWSQARFGDLLSTLLDFRGRTPKKLGMEWGGTIPALSAVNVRQGRIDLSRTPHFGSEELYERWMTMGDPAKDDIVLTMEAPLGNVAQIPDNQRYILSQRVVLLKTREGIDPAFLAHQMRAPDFRERLLANATGTTATGISQARLRELQANVAPAPEQKRIADKLDALLARVDACRGRLDRVPDILKRFRQSVLAAATSGELTREWREERGLDLAGWETTTVATLLEGKPRNGYSPRAVERPTAVKSLTLTATTTGAFRGEHSKYIDEEIPPESHLWLVPGDILIQRANTLEYVGVSAVFDGPSATFIYPDLMMKCRANARVVTPFLHCVLSSAPVRTFFRENATGTAGNMPKINQQTVLAAPAVLPPLDEQREIVRRMESLLPFADQLDRFGDRSRELIEKLTPSVLAKAFRGELVPQDPDDEPASDLLAKLTAGQSDPAPKPRRRQTKSGKRPTMSNTDKDAIKAAILKLKTDRFSFDELRAQVAGDHESLKTALFELLEEPSPVIRQVFDSKTKAMQLVRVTP